MAMADDVCSIMVGLLSLVASPGFLLSKAWNWILSLKQGDKLKATLEEGEPPEKAAPSTRKRSWCVPGCVGMYDALFHCIKTR